MARRVYYVCVCLRLRGCRAVGALLAPHRRVNIDTPPHHRHTRAAGTRHYTTVDLRLHGWSSAPPPALATRCALTVSYKLI